MGVKFDELWKLKSQDSRNIVESKRELTWYDYIVTAKTKKDFEMEVWNQNHPVEENTTKHICKAGTTVRIWMVSRFGDAGITDNLTNPHGYDCRNVDVDNDLEDIKLELIPRKEVKEQKIEGIPVA